MKRRNWYLFMLVCLAIVVAALPVACTKEPEIGTDVGKRAPDFTLKTLDDGKTVKLSDFRGKTLILNFWVTTCHACILELRYLQYIYNKPSNKNLAVLAVNAGESAATIKDVLGNQRPSYPILLDPQGEVCIKYGHGAPTTFFIDSRGVIRAIKNEGFGGPEEIEDMLTSFR